MRVQILLALLLAAVVVAAAATPGGLEDRKAKKPTPGKSTKTTKRPTPKGKTAKSTKARPTLPTMPGKMMSATISSAVTSLEILSATTSPETSILETSLPETSMPETSMSESSLPEMSMPETSMPETTMPETTLPATSMSETTMSATTRPESIMSAMTRSESIMPATTRSETTMTTTTTSAKTKSAKTKSAKTKSAKTTSPKTIPATTMSTMTTSPKTSSATSIPATTLSTTTTMSASSSVPSGFVTRSGRGFVLNGEPFYYVGTNAYWAQSLSQQDLTSLFSQMNAAGMKVLRIFGWGDNVGGPNDNSFQYWSGSNNTPNPAAFAAHFDPIIKSAEEAGIKIVVPMIGNWGQSISLYIQQVLGSSGPHDSFFWNQQIITCYKKYVDFWVTRYIDSPAIFAWELINEPNCEGDQGRKTSANCTQAAMTAWVTTISEYIKSIDPHHMVTIGDEGWLTPKDGFGSSSPYNGHAIDWSTNLKVNTLDYGTVHLYPSSWGQSWDFGTDWIKQHAQIANSVGKPLVLEEFGVDNTGIRYSTLTTWLNAAVSTDWNGIQYWQFVGSFPSGYRSPDDGNGISTTEQSYSLIKSIASTMNGKTGHS